MNTILYYYESSAGVTNIGTGAEAGATAGTTSIGLTEILKAADGMEINFQRITISSNIADETLAVKRRGSGMVDYGAPSIGQDTAMPRPSRHPTAPATLSLGLGHRRLLVSKTSPHWLDLAAARFP